MKNAFLVAGPIPFIARIVLHGDGYGAYYGGKWALTLQENTPHVEFFDARYGHTPFGQFTGARYGAQDFLGFAPHQGLCLDGGTPEWSISGEAVAKVQAWISAFDMESQSNNAKELPDGDYVLSEDAAWLDVKNFSLRVRRAQKCVVVEVFDAQVAKESGDVDGALLATTFVMDEECEHIQKQRQVNDRSVAGTLG